MYIKTLSFVCLHRNLSFRPSHYYVCKSLDTRTIGLPGFRSLDTMFTLNWCSLESWDPVNMVNSWSYTFQEVKSDRTSDPEIVVSTDISSRHLSVFDKLMKVGIDYPHSPFPWICLCIGINLILKVCGRITQGPPTEAQLKY